MLFRSRRYYVIAPAMRCRTHVSAFALVVYRHDPNRTPIATYQVPRLYRVEVQRPIFEALLYRISIFLKLLRKENTFYRFPNNHLFLYTAFLAVRTVVVLVDLIPKI